jgi:hypothetical protein
MIRIAELGLSNRYSMHARNRTGSRYALIVIQRARTPWRTKLGDELRAPTETHLHESTPLPWPVSPQHLRLCVINTGAERQLIRGEDESSGEAGVRGSRGSPYCFPATIKVI